MRNYEALKQELRRPEIKDYLESVTHHKVLTPNETLDLIIAYQSGIKEALDTLVKHNMKLVISVAKNYVGRGVGLEDLCQEGALGIKTAVEKFNVKKDIQFSTYAYNWIRKLIGVAITEQSGTYKVPFAHAVLANKALTIRGELESLVCREVTDEEIAASLHVNVVKLKSAIKSVQGSISTNEKVAGTDEDITIEEMLSDNCNLEESVDNRELSDDLDTILHNYLEPHEIYLIKYMFGYYCDKPKFDEIAIKLCITEERARQMFTRAKKKLDNPDIRKIIGDVL